MLTPVEQAKLIELKRKSESYAPLTNEEFETLENRSVQEIELASSKRFQEWLQAWNNLCQWSSILAKDNLRLIQEIRYLKQEIKNHIEQRDEADNEKV